MSEETQVSKEAVAENDTKSTESNDNSELIAESKRKIRLVLINGKTMKQLSEKHF